MINQLKLMLFTREVTSRLPRIRGLGIILALIARSFRCKNLSDVEVSVLGRKMLLTPSDLLDNRLIFTPQWFDYQERRFIRKILSKGDYVIDVGANIGAYTLVFADLVGSQGAVTAIEAELENAKRLRHNINLNNIRWVDVCNIGVSDKNEVLTLLLNSTGNVGGHSFFEQSDTEEPPVQEVQCRPLSELIDTTKKPKLMKLDIEGFEHRVLHRYFDDIRDTQWPEFILLEDDPLRREDDAVSLILSRGYKIIKRFDLNVLVGR